MSAPDSGVDLSYCRRHSYHRERNAYVVRNQPRAPRNELPAAPGRPNAWAPRHVGDMELNDPDIVDRVLLEHEVPRYGACWQEPQNVERGGPTIQQNENLTPRRHVPSISSGAGNTSIFWPEEIWSLNCVNRCTQLLVSIALTVVGIAGGIFSLHYFKRPVGWVLMSVSTAVAGILLIKRSLHKLCCPRATQI